MNNEHPNAKIEEKRKAAENVKHDQTRSTTHCGEHRQAADAAGQAAVLRG
jgi:hypothetical protein